MELDHSPSVQWLREYDLFNLDKLFLRGLLKCGLPGPPEKVLRRWSKAFHGVAWVRENKYTLK